MKIITLPRELVEQALEALEAFLSDELRPYEAAKASAALKAALAQEQAEPVQEPVAWMYTGVMSNGIEHGPHLIWKPESMDAMSARKGVKAAPLYTAPPKTEPLTEEEIYAAIKGVDSLRAVEVARAVERAIKRAHGIGDNT